VNSVPWQTVQSEHQDVFSRQLVTVLDPSNRASEAFRILRTSLFSALADSPPQAIVVTSPGRAEGKSTVCANLGVVLAQAGNRTLLVDCNLREPAVHSIFGLPITPGIEKVIDGARDSEEIYQEPIPNLKVLTAGVAPPISTEVLGSQRFLEFLVSARQEFEYVLLDSPSATLVSDPALLATQADGVLLVLNARKTSRKDLHAAVRILAAAGAFVLGTVMNDLREI
jgi:capsular exopolysaccharide synthesis family protein